MPKKQKPVIQRPVTKRQLSRWQRQQRVQRLVMIGGFSIIALLLAIIAYGYYDNEVKPFHQPATRVNSTIFNMDYYVNMLRIQTEAQSGLPPDYLAGFVLRGIQQSELVRQKAEELGYQVDDEEIDETLEEYDLPNDREHRDMVAAELLIDKLRQEHFEIKVPQTALHAHILAMVIESEDDVTEIKARIEAGEEFKALAEKLSLDDMTKSKGGDLGWLSREYTSIWFDNPVFEQAAFSLDAGAFSEPIYDEEVRKKIGYWIIEVVETEDEGFEEEEEEEDEEYVPERVRAHVILLGSQQEAETVRSRLEAGEDFGDLANELSQDQLSKENDGDIGWVEEGKRSQALVDAALSLDLNVLSEPVRDELVYTSGGYWLIQVSEKDDNRAYEEEHREAIITKLYNDWMSQLWEDSQEQIESFLDDDKKAWALKQVSREG